MIKLWICCGLGMVWAGGVGAQDDFSAFEQMEQEAFAQFEEMERGARLAWERRDAALAKKWEEERKAMLAAFVIKEEEAKKDPRKKVKTYADKKDEVAQSQVDFAAGKVKVEAVAVAASEEAARQKAEKLAKEKLQEAVGQVPATGGKTLAQQGGDDKRKKQVAQVHDETLKTSTKLPDGKVEARVSLEQPLTGKKGLVALALENAEKVPEVEAAVEEEPAKPVEAEKDDTVQQAAKTTKAKPQAAAKVTEPVQAAAPATDTATEKVAPAAPAADVAAKKAAPKTAQGPFTGLLLDASTVPRARPALVPKVRGAGGDEVYGPATVNKEKAIHGMAAWLKDEAEVGGNAKLGSNPLRVKVTAVKRGGAMTVGDADVARIRAADTGFLAECKVAVLLGR